MTAWTTDPPQYSAYYWAVPENRASWLDCSPEVVYVYFDGKWSVARPGKHRHDRIEDFTHWCGPLDRPPLPPGVDDEE